MQRAFPSSLAFAIALAVLAIAGFVVTLNRSPVAWPDSIIYASVARSLQLNHSGVPTVLRDSPAAIDHLPFYGPVFFHLVAWVFALFGLSDASLRSVSLAGALLIALGGAGLVRVLGGDRERQAWVGTLLLLSPEIGRAATDGRMDSIAVAFEVLALAAFTRGLRDRRDPWQHGTAAGVLIAAAALTTPRAYPFVTAFFIGSAAPMWTANERRVEGHQFAACWITVLILGGSWIAAAHGSPARWLGYMSSIATRGNVDVAFLAAGRDWSFSPWAMITPLAIVAAAVVAGRHTPVLRRSAERVGWLVAGLTLAIGLALFNFTFFFSIYLFIPLLVVGLAAASVRQNRVAAKLIVALLAADVTVRTGRYVRLATVWPGTNPEQIERFITAHVPPGSDVVGEESFYFFAVERAGSRYLFTTHSSADWTRWVAETDPSRSRTVQRAAGPAAPRFLIWPADEARYPIPPDLACNRGETVAVLDPLPGGRRFSAFRLEPRNTVVYPKTVLYRLAPARPDTMTRCPASN